MIRPTTPSDFDYLQSAGSHLPKSEPQLDRMPDSRTQFEPSATYRRVARRPNKAHTATARCIARLYDATFNEGSGFDIQTDRLTVEVETTATMYDAFERPTGASRPCLRRVDKQGWGHRGTPSQPR